MNTVIYYGMKFLDAIINYCIQDKNQISWLVISIKNHEIQFVMIESH